MSATLAQLNDRARRKMGLGLGSHTVTLTYASIADGDTVTVHGIILTCQTDANPPYELANFKKETDAAATAANLEDLIDAIFDTTTGLLQSGVSASASSGVVTITGARSITTDNAAGFVISASSTSDEPPFTSDFDQWILDGQLDVISKASFGVLAAGETGKIIEEFDVTGANGTLVALAKPTNLLRPEIVSAKIGSDSQNYRLTHIKPDLLLEIREGKNTIYKVDSADGATKYWSYWNEKIQFSAAPASSSTPTIIGIKQPQTTKSSNSDLPNHLHALVEDYAVIMAWQQKNRADIAGALYQKYLTDFQIINANYQVRR